MGGNIRVRVRFGKYRKPPRSVMDLDSCYETLRQLEESMHTLRNNLQRVVEDQDEKGLSLDKSRFERLAQICAGAKVGKR